MNNHGNNPYLRAGVYPPSHAARARMPGHHHGGARRPLTAPTPNYQGAMCPAPPTRLTPCPPPTPQPCPPPTMQPYTPPMSEEQLCQLFAVMRSMGQWHPMMGAEAADHHHHDAEVRPIIYGVDSGELIPVDASAVITVTPQKRHIPEKLVLTQVIAGSFVINAIAAGVEPVLATTGPISAAIFVQDSTSAAFKSVVMDVGMDFSVGVTNISNAPARFISTVVGRPVPAGY